MRTLFLNALGAVLLLPLICGEMEKLKGTVMADSKKLSCSFTLVYKGLDMDLKKSKASCKPKLKKFVREYTINSGEKKFTFTMTFKANGKISLSKANIQPLPLPTKPPTSTTPPCSVGFTLVCSSISPTEGDNMTEVCPLALLTGSAKNVQQPPMTMRVTEKCSCLPTSGVERDLELGISPLGNRHQGCVKIDPELVFPNLNEKMKAINMSQMKADWNISNIVSSMTANRTSKDHMEQALTEAMVETMHHELAVQSGGRISRFVRSSKYSDIIAHNYMISRNLESTAKKLTARMSNQEQNLFQETCKQLNEELLRDPECEAGCNATSSRRSFSGCCNNIANKNHGRANRAFSRLMPNAYTDGISLPRGGVNPSTLPSPRKVSSSVHGVRETKTKPPISVMLMQFGQFVDHDITLTPEQDLECCSSTIELEDLRMPEDLRMCFNIDTSDDDFYFGKMACHPFTRSDAICTDNKTREQFNSITSYLDASNVYGSDAATAQKLRSKTGGWMKTHKLGPVLPSRRQASFDSLHGEDPNDLVGGDVRAIEQPGLASMHSLFINEHNRIAELFNENVINRTDEEIYEAARKLVGAEIQNIVYNEFLPIVLGDQTMDKYKLKLPEDIEDDTVYDPSIDPTIFNEFATVAYRFGHSLIPNLLLPSSNLPIRNSDHCPLNDNFFQFDEFVIGADKSGKAWQNLLIGMQYQRSPAMDASVSSNVLEYLFCGENCKLPEGFGQDLAARNIQRGRDHGLPSYLRFRELCNMSSPTDWDSRPDDIPDRNWKNLQQAYKNVDDIDPFTGGLSEDAVEGGLVGETFACIIGLQFARLKEGDRFFFIHSVDGDQSEKGLPKKAKVAIRKRSLGDIICDNTDVSSTPALVMVIDHDEVEQACDARGGLAYSDIEELLLTKTETKGDPQCSRPYKILSDKWRMVEYGVPHPTSHCDQTGFTTGWHAFRFDSRYATLPSSPPAEENRGYDQKTCGTRRSSWSPSALPTMGQAPQDINIHFAFLSDEILSGYSVTGKVVACPGEDGQNMFLYYLPQVKRCRSAYCAL